jgi:hypothetical protein
MERVFILHLRNENKRVTEADAIRNAEEQQAAGVAPMYQYRNTNGDAITPRGWLVWSTWEDGAGVVYRRDDGKMILVTGWQGDFIAG